MYRVIEIYIITNKNTSSIVKMVMLPAPKPGDCESDYNLSTEMTIVAVLTVSLWQTMLSEQGVIIVQSVARIYKAGNRTKG